MMKQDGRQIIFITGTDTAVGKTLVAAILTEALEADYWKPVQAGIEEGTDSEWVRSRLSNRDLTVHPEKYRLRLAASPHIASREEGIEIGLPSILDALPPGRRPLVVEGAGGLMVPLAPQLFVADLAKALGARVVLVSRNMLGSINHSLLTAMACRQQGLQVMGWVFNDQYLQYEDEIVRWTGFPSLGSVPFCAAPHQEFIRRQADIFKKQWTRSTW